MIAYLFPGQGAQKPGFLHALGAHPAIATTLDEASAALGHAALELDTEEALRSTLAVQPALVIAGVALARALAAEGIAPDAVAGLSVGAFAAAVVCGSLALDDALRLVKLRAQLMEQAFPSGYGLAALVGLNEPQVLQLIERLGVPAYLGNVNAPRQIVVAGSDAALATLLAAAPAAGARKAERLAVSVPSHCVLLDDAARQLQAAAASVHFAAPRIPYLGNRRARALQNADALRDDVLTNLRYPVRWHDATTVLHEIGTRVFVELPPGNILSSLVNETWPEVTAIALEHLPIADAAAIIRARVARQQAS